MVRKSNSPTHNSYVMRIVTSALVHTLAPHCHYHWTKEDEHVMKNIVVVNDGLALDLVEQLLCSMGLLKLTTMWWLQYLGKEVGSLN